MQFLILEKWVSGEADDQGVNVSAAEADKEFETAKKQSFPKEKDFQDFLKSSGMTLADAKFQVRFNTVYTKLREKAVKGADKVTDKAVKKFYDEEQGALRDARLARPARHPDEDRGARQRGQAGAGERPELDRRRQALLDRPGVQGPGRIAAGHREGHAGEVLRRRDLRGAARAS